MLDTVKKFFWDAVKGAVRALGLKVLLAVVGVFVVFQAWSYGMGTLKCRNAWIDSGFEYKYTYRAGCMIERDGHWIREGNYRFSD